MAQPSPQNPIQLWTTKVDREKYESYADLYAIIKTVEKLEKASLRRANDMTRSERLARRTCATLCGQRSTRPPV
jgi:ESCRT-I complex subunit VPS28